MSEIFKSILKIQQERQKNKAYGLLNVQNFTTGSFCNENLAKNINTSKHKTLHQNTTENINQ